MARVTVHLNGKRRGAITPAIHQIQGQSRLARDAIREAAALQHVKAGDAIGSMVSASFDTHWGSMVRTYHPEMDTPEAHEQSQLVLPNGKVEMAEHRVTTDRFVTHMVQNHANTQAALAAKRDYLRSLSAKRNDVNSLKLDND